jgi:hypothetical protein
MSKVKIQGHASGTGVLTVTAPNTSTDRTITLPDGTGTLLTTDGDGSSLTGISSGLPLTGGTLTGNLTVGSVADPTISLLSNASNAASSGSLKFREGDGVNGFDLRYDGSDNNFIIDSNNVSNAVVIERTTGDLGLSTTSPTEKLHVVVAGSSDTYVTGIKIANDTDTSGENVGISFGSPSWGDGAAVYAKDLSDDGKCDLGFAVRVNGAPTERLTLKSDGRGLSQFTAKAWIQFNASNTIQDSHNVSSISDNGTGRTDINWTNAMANDDYSCQTNSSVADIWLKVNSLATTEANLRSVNADGNYQTCTYNFVTVFGD